MATSSTNANIVYTAFRDREGNSYFKLTCKGCWWGSYDQDKWVTMHQGFLFLKWAKKHRMTFITSTRLTCSRHRFMYIFKQKRVTLLRGSEPCAPFVASALCTLLHRLPCINLKREIHTLYFLPVIWQWVPSSWVFSWSQRSLYCLLLSCPGQNQVYPQNVSSFSLLCCTSCALCLLVVWPLDDSFKEVSWWGRPVHRRQDRHHQWWVGRRPDEYPRPGSWLTSSIVSWAVFYSHCILYAIHAFF